MPLETRSRGCEACKRRKIKCDGRTPVCAKCEKLGIECSGPVVGPIILPWNRRKMLEKQQSFALSTSPMDGAPSDGTSASQSLAPYAFNGFHNLSDDLIMKDCLTLKLKEVVFIPHQRHRSLVTDLVKYSSSNELPMLQRAIWATSAAFNGVASDKPELIKKSQELYASVLRCLLKELSRGTAQEHGEQQTINPQHPVSIEMVAVAALFVWYEAIMGTNPNGWIAHTFGAGRILLRRMPEDYVLGLSHSIFRTVRYQMANASVLTVQSTMFAATPWMTIPFSKISKTGFDKLTDFMLVIPKSLSWVSEKCVGELPISPSIEAASVVEDVRLLEQALNNFLLNYEEEMIRAGKRGLFLEISQDRIDSNGTYHPKVRQYFSDEIAECVAHYEMCQLLITLIKAAFSDSRSFIANRAAAVEHSASALSGVAFSEARSTTRMIREHFGYVCLLITIFVASPDEAHKKYTKLKIESWGGGNGLIGASPYHPIVRWHELSKIWQKMALQPDTVQLSDNNEHSSTLDV